MVYFNSDGDVKLGAVSCEDENGNKSVAVSVETISIKDKVRIATVTTTKDGEKAESLIAQGVKDFWKIVYNNDDLLRAVRIFLKEGNSWPGIYKVVNDTILLSGPDVVNLGWVSDSKVRLLKRTANCYRAIGDEARHAVKDWTPPPNPMTINEAINIEQDLIRKWIQFEASKVT